MELRLATLDDLPSLEKMFLKIVDNMNKNGIRIWNQYYPIEEFEQDIKDKSLYIVLDNNDIVSAFALLNSISSKDFYEWENKDARALYLSRLGVNVDYLKRGIGKITLNFAKEVVKQKGYDYLRLSVVNNNYPAIRLYEKSGFKRAGGEYVEYIPDTDLRFNEIGFEIKV